MSLLRQVLLLILLGGIAYGGFTAYERYMGGEAVQGAAGGADGGRRGGREARVEVTRAELHTIRSRIEAVGSTKALQAIDIVPLSSGQVVSISFEPGQEVDAGQVLLRLDDTLEQAAVSEAEARLGQTRVALDRATKLRRSGNTAQSTLDEATVAEEAAAAQLSAARKKLDDRSVAAPFEGMVGMRNVDMGARVDDNTVVTTLDDLSQVLVEFSVPETWFGAVTVGQTVKARAATWPDRVFVGKIESIDSRIATATRAFKIRAILPNADRALPAGMFLYVEIELDERQALLAPEQAVQASAQGSYLFVAEDGRAVMRHVTVGQRENGMVEITSGIAEGDEVISTGLQRLRDGIAIQTGDDRKQPQAGSGENDKAGQDKGAGA